MKTHLKYSLMLIQIFILTLNICISQEYPISENKAISLITENILFITYNEYLQNKYNVKETYSIEIDEMSFENENINTFYFLTFYNEINNLKNGEVTSITFIINVFSGKIEIKQPIFLMNEEFRKYLIDPENYVKNYFKDKIN